MDILIPFYIFSCSLQSHFCIFIYFILIRVLASLEVGGARFKKGGGKHIIYVICGRRKASSRRSYYYTHLVSKASTLTFKNTNHQQMKRSQLVF